MIVIFKVICQINVFLILGSVFCLDVLRNQNVGAYYRKISVW